MRIFSAHNKWWVTPEVILPLPYETYFSDFFATTTADHRLRQCIEFYMRTGIEKYGNNMGAFVLKYRLSQQQKNGTT